VIHQPAIGRVGYAAQYNRVLVLDRDFEILAGGQAQLFADSQGQDDLAFLGEYRGHVGKSYRAVEGKAIQKILKKCLIWQIDVDGREIAGATWRWPEARMS